MSNGERTDERTSMMQPLTHTLDTIIERVLGQSTVDEGEEILFHVREESGQDLPSRNFVAVCCYHNDKNFKRDKHLNVFI